MDGGDRLRDLCEALRHVRDLNAKYAPPVVAQRLEITERLRLLENPEGEFLAGDWHVMRIIADQLEEDARVGTALV